MEKVIFLDRDGTINIEKNYLHKIENWEWQPKAKEAIKIFKNKGYKVIIITNQSGVARGYFSEEEVQRLHDYMEDELKKEGIKIDKILYCPHHIKGNKKYKKKCKNRKPGIGFFEKIFKSYNTDLKKSVMVGDKISDLESAVRVGIRPILVETGYGKKTKRELYFKVKKYKSLYDFAKNL
ncbi:MAG: D-glycero-beta-D-manno-heptose 1,7-bisphosphate 7-phosphatase [Fusobacteriota bacterium]